jgi:hypothetical protein
MLQIVSKREEALDLSGGAFNGRGSRKAALQGGGSLLHYSILNGIIKMIQGSVIIPFDLL